MLEKKIGCYKCVLPEGYVGAIFEKTKEGIICNFCKEFEEQDFLGEEALINHLSLGAHERVGVTVSGGKDSIYVWSWLVDRLSCERVVAFNKKSPTKVGVFFKPQNGQESAKAEV